MGSKESKTSSLTFDDAVKRVSEAELSRLKEAYKKYATVNGIMTKQGFIRDVLGDTVPLSLAELLYLTCGGTAKGIIFKDLLCSLVLLTRGTREERYKFIFGVYANETGSHVLRSDMLQQIQSTEKDYSLEAVQKCFKHGERVQYEDFRNWLMLFPEATTITRWLLDDQCYVTLSNDLEMPTFYQTLSGVTHLEEKEIIELEKRYWILKGSSITGKLDLETLVPILSPPLPFQIAKGFFNAFDENRDNHIDFKEMACGISAACRGPQTERQKFCFRIFDVDKDGRLNEKELRDMLHALLLMQNECENCSDGNCTATSSEKITNIMNELYKNHDPTISGSITQEEYLIWALNNRLAESLSEVIFQLCHIVLGLRPSNALEEGEIVLGWLRRAELRDIAVGQFWYLINMEWWKLWIDYVSAQGNSRVSSPSSSSSHSGSSSSLNGSIKQTRLQKKSASFKDVLPADNSGVTVTSISKKDFLASEKDVLCNSLPNSICNGHNSRISASNSSPNASAYTVQISPTCPPAVDNSPLLEPTTCKVTQLTGEGGRLKKTIVQGKDFMLVPDSLWKALQQWYGGAPALPRQIIHGRTNEEVELELYPVMLRILRHSQPPSRPQSNNWVGVVGGYGVAALSKITDSTPSYLSPGPSISLFSPKRYLAYVAAFSCLATLSQVYQYLASKIRLKSEDMRIWLIREESPLGMTLLEDEDVTLEDCGVKDLNQVLLEVRNKDLTWPEEMSQISASRGIISRLSSKTDKGVTGLNNLGNTCFLNAALQCCSNTAPLTKYFLRNMHLYELNPENPSGMKGHMALHYGNLMFEIWGGNLKTVAPLKLRWVIGRYSGNFTGFQQQDSQELLSFLLDGLHEDLNRVYHKPYVELKDSEGRPDTLVAQEAWENHLLRNKSIIVDLFHGQLKSKVTCKICKHESTRFDPFSYLSLPLPMEIIKIDGSTPVKYGVRLVSESKYADIKQYLSSLTGISHHQFMLAEMINAQIKGIPADSGSIRSINGNILYAYELPIVFSPSAKESCSINDDICDRKRFSLIQRTSHCSAPLFTGEGPVKNCNSALSKSASSNRDTNNISGIHHKSKSETVVFPSSAINGNLSFIQSDSDLINTHKGFLVAFHRKMIRQEVYFLSSQKTKASLFGLPVVVHCNNSTSQYDIYQNIWVQVCHLVSPLPPSESGSNHAHDCDDSLGYEFPFILRVVDRDGLQCAWCPWYRFCRGCEIHCNESVFSSNVSFLAIDWDPTALHLRYQSSLEKAFIEHPSIEELRRKHTEPISLSHCLEAFCSDETLEYSCDKCKKLQEAEKKLQIWRLPPILIVHLKRFQYLGNKWIKSQKIVQFPMNNFDPTEFLASVPRHTILLHRAELEGVDPTAYISSLSEKENVFLDFSPENKAISELKDLDDLKNIKISNSAKNIASSPNLSSQGKFRKPRVRNGSVLYGDALQDFHQHRLEDNCDPLDLKYELYAIVCHNGVMEGGHYVCYALNNNGKWICYNDSSAKEVSESEIDFQTAYILFYQRKNISVEKYMPSTESKVPYSKDIGDDCEAEYKKQCIVM